MKKELIDLLSVYLGELLYKHETTFDWIEKDQVSRQINAVYTLLDIDKKEHTFNDTAREILKTFKTS
jgi:hypothetical protein